mmetsp:Transcript_21127/g.30646  ORF Transcript_21127/g.30646 Transcript_21127/m.30646 type:complete len:271 (-) Transcript_21127:279-1091(-)|eukprot:CAMPEP_0113946350 /NCGR_PEP_ID=MMETSP1339-20121228/56749_1 /TAXON_ID=94617 /ORGANISM="Fibrocapsa japonica" /LENGTH=270 /DNA_ID=CAMNT_0000952393 /DNA_START=92 /DNA_END=904 /DNA_ORIENTATION=+ /assembly_acc=CAM_ASM_000762
MASKGLTSPEHAVIIFGEEVVDVNHQELSEKMLTEFEKLLKPSHVWERLYPREDQLTVEGAAVGGLFLNSGLKVTRSSAEVDATPRDLFNFLTSQEGLGVIDVNIDPNNVPRPFLSLNYHPKGSIEVRRSTQQLSFPYSPRDLCTLCVTDSSRYRMCIKSIISPHIPGASIYSQSEDNAAAQPQGLMAGLAQTLSCRMVCGGGDSMNERAFTTFGIKVEPAPGGRSRVSIVMFTDLCGSFPRYQMNELNRKYHSRFHRRLREAYGSTVEL